MIRSSIILMETELSQDEFEIWLLDYLKKISTKPDKTSVKSNKYISIDLLFEN